MFGNGWTKFNTFETASFDEIRLFDLKISPSQFDVLLQARDTEVVRRFPISSLRADFQTNSGPLLRPVYLVAFEGSKP